MEVKIDIDSYLTEEDVKQIVEDEVRRYPQEIRERIVRCRDCIHANPYSDCRDEGEWLDCLHFAEWDYYADVPGHCPVRPDFFCAHGETEEDE